VGGCLPERSVATSTIAFNQWIATRLVVCDVGRIAARIAYEDFCHWAKTKGIEPCSETRFGRDLTDRITSAGGVKVKRRDRTYYEGVRVQPKFAGSATKRPPSNVYSYLK